MGPVTNNPFLIAIINMIPQRRKRRPKLPLRLLPLRPLLLLQLRLLRIRAKKSQRLSLRLLLPAAVPKT